MLQEQPHKESQRSKQVPKTASRTHVQPTGAATRDQALTIMIKEQIFLLHSTKRIQQLQEQQTHRITAIIIFPDTIK